MKMEAVLLTGHGGFEKLEYRTDIPVPAPAAGEVLIKVAAAGVNNTDINTRIGWYSRGVASGTNTGGAEGFGTAEDGDATWSGTPMAFPRIQGADACGRIVAVGDGVERSWIGERVMVRNMLRSYVDYRPYECWTFGSECDGGFAQFAVAPSRETDAISCDWSDAELASMLEAGSVRPVVAKTYPLKDIVAAQKDFLAKSHVGKLVLTPSQETFG